jgi:aminoglycoside phosphotransferase (APT) family kinase protein
VLYRLATATQPRPFVLYEYLEGKMWDRHRPSAGELAELADLWLTVASMPDEGLWPGRGAHRSFEEIAANLLRPAFQEYAEWAKTEHPPGLELAEECRAVMESRQGVVEELSRHDPGWCFCHADPRFANIIRRPEGSLGWVDWEDAGLRDPARDLADFVCHPNQEDLLSMEEWRPFLELCLASRAALDPGVQYRFHVYLALFPLGYLAVLLGEGVRRTREGELLGWRINGMPANERLRRFLAWAQAWPETDFADRLHALRGVQFFCLEKDACLD